MFAAGVGWVFRASGCLGTYIGDPGGQSASGRGALLSGLSGLDWTIAGEVLSVATAVKLHGEGDGDKEERLVLRTIDGRDQPGQGCTGRSRLISPGLG